MVNNPRDVDFLHFSLISKISLATVNIRRGTEYQFLKPMQSKCLKSALKCDTMAILPTGYGKSLIFELLPLLAGKLLLGHATPTILICSPLNSIIEEQTRRYGQHAIHINGDLALNLAQGNACRNFKAAGFTYVIGHPEHLLHKDICDIFCTEVWQKKVTHIVIDEAHSVLQWGAEFRPDFLKLPKLRSIFPSAVVLALTATATKSTREEICKVLAMNSANIIASSVDRPNIKYIVEKRLPNIHAELSFEMVIDPLVKELVEKMTAFPKTIIYSKLKFCGAGYESCIREEQLQGYNLKDLVSQYHASCTVEMKKKIVEAMASKDSDLKLLFATEAYSMGTDAPDVRRVIHIGVPSTLETYIQEAGRGGRDGFPCEAKLFFNNNDIAMNVRGMTEAVRKYCRSDQCRREFLCEHFGFDLHLSPSHVGHNCCDVCECSCSCMTCKQRITTQEVLEDFTHDSAPVSSTLLSDLLTQFFKAENEINGKVFTGLTDGLIKEIVKNSCAFNNPDNIKSIYPNLKDCYVANIVQIIEKANENDNE